MNRAASISDHLSFSYFRYSTACQARSTPHTSCLAKFQKTYCVRARRSDYAASLRMEGFDTSTAESKRRLPSREELLNSYRKKNRPNGRQIRRRT
ncbi:YhfG family protein [Pseudomonas sp. UBA1879]|uniref:YhfG family protein n=1 Tax=Pseudomonas sp. UBA1879 TaxID=1947305 RepID=UPI0032E3D8BB